ncbi:MAG: BREX-1 system adenine-specific DNA-methyltransferase PglX [Bacteroidales bacterium]|nr:BREX-1 system adenine-specific DNA-methyltransferase PglX [Bacteroidales bacterium]
MDTNKLKKFAGEARVKLKAGVAGMLQLYGFDANGNASSMPERITGGAIFNGTTITDETFYDKWMSLYNAIQAHGVKEVYEEVAYTWFNRFMAIRIMRKNGFINPVLEYNNQDLRIPAIVADARRGNIPPMQEVDRRRLQELLLDDSKTSGQFAILIVAYCQNNPILKSCFGKINDYTEFLLPKNILAPGDFVDMINNTPFITEEDYKHSELIGWLYQFYISEKKDEIFAAFKDGKKAAAEDIPAATQIFTPNWIVKYMVQNTLGRIYLDNFENDSLKDSWKYLVPPAEGETAKLTVSELEELTLIDPGCGSGHILSEAFEMLYEMYRADFASPREACTSILTRNLTGIDLDTRAKQLSQFSILMKACQKDDSFLSAAILPRIYDMPEPYRSSVPLRDTLPHFFLGCNKQTLEETAKSIELMDQAKNLGSIMKFDISENTRYQIEKRLKEVRSQSPMNPTFAELAPYFDVILALTDKYACVVANPPYMSSSNMNARLAKYVKAKYPEGKADLFAVFMYVAMDILKKDGKMGMINMQSWMFLSSFETLRNTFLTKFHIDNMLHLGPHTFDELGGEVVQNTAFTISNTRPSTDDHGIYYRLVNGKNCTEKESNFFNGEGLFKNIPQSNFHRVPGSPIGYWISEKALEPFNNRKIGDITLSDGQILTGDNDRFIRYFWETNVHQTGIDSGKKWTLMAKGGGFRKWYGNIINTVNWSPEARDFYKKDKTARILAEKYWYREAVTWGVISTIHPSFRLLPEGYLFNKGGYSLFFNNKEDKNLIIGLLNTKYPEFVLQLINPTLSTTIKDVQSIPWFESSNKGYLNELSESNIAISRLDWDNHETSWDFKTNGIVELSRRGLGTIKAGLGDSPAIVNMCDLSLLMAKYKAYWGIKFDELHANEEELNRQFIDIYGLRDELTPDVPLNEVTILQQGEISIEDGQIVWHEDVIIKQLISYIIGCYMGRYRLDREGLAIAHPNPSADEIAPYTFTSVFGTEQPFEIDEDGLIPTLPSDSGFADNALLAVRQFIQKVFGEDSYAANLNYIENCLGKSLEDYLFKNFWNDHKKMYQKRPIYWLFSSKKGAFKVLAYCHRMTRHTAELVRQKYLLPYIDRMKGRADEIQAKGANASAAERRQLKTLTANIAECEEYHTRLHAIADQQIAFDLDDGVIKNYALFGDVLSKIK